MRLEQAPRFQPGDTVRYVGKGKTREPGLAIVPGTLGSVVSPPVVRRVTPASPEQMACQVMFGYRIAWIPVDRLEAEMWQ
jgi:hypothetical protein